MTAGGTRSGRLALCVVSPCYNEAAGIRRFHEALARVLDAQPDLDWSVVLVDDGSKDGSLAALEQAARSGRAPRA